MRDLKVLRDPCRTIFVILPLYSILAYSFETRVLQMARVVYREYPAKGCNLQNGPFIHLAFRDFALKGGIHGSAHV